MDSDTLLPQNIPYILHSRKTPPEEPLHSREFPFHHKDETVLDRFSQFHPAVLLLQMVFYS